MLFRSLYSTGFRRRRENRISRTTYRGTPKAGLYTRLSVDDGYVDRESNSITSQKQMLTQFAEYHGIEIVETYVDDADIIGLNQKTFDLRGFTD